MIDTDFWRERRVFLSGHTGFKGGWTALLLHSLGARVFGFALPPEGEPNLFAAAGIERDLHHCIGDLRDFSAVSSAIAEARPDIVIHMGAQSLVRRSYLDPVSTYATNVMGTVHLLEAVRHAPSVRAVVVVTSDKCYENRNVPRGYQETDPLGGHDPYSNSKGCAELVTDAYRRSFYSTPSSASVATARAGNVIGGGDWAEDRLIPDAMRAFMAEEPLLIRNPLAIRPWQHVLDPVLAYLLLAERLFARPGAFAQAWNFGPSADSEVSVETVVNRVVRLWGAGAGWQNDGGEHPHEAACLKLDCTKAATQLGWRPLLSLDDALRLTVEWYRAFQDGGDMRAVTLGQIGRILGTGGLRGVQTRGLAMS
ncbi:MAG: CDP-glucose 4,6-dehydratase [Xanthobacteraceae bacterium]|nr:CDP-glucose 4,6-dehydratase [Xanthobacteraceae bacterium]